MKRSSILIFVAFSVLLFSCGGDKVKNIEEPDNIELVKIEYEFTEIPIFEPNRILFPVFDTIIQSVRECPEIKEDLCVYCLSVTKTNENSTILSIELRERETIYCSKIDGVFLYKNAVFKLNLNEQDSMYFRPCERVGRVKCQKDNIFTHDINDNMFGAWEYAIEDGESKCISFSICAKHGRDETFYPIAYP